MAMTWISPYVKIYWTKRFVRHRPCGLRGSLRRAKNEHRVKKRPILFLIKHKIQCIRKPYKPKQPQRRNYNTFYDHMQIPS